MHHTIEDSSADAYDTIARVNRIGNLEATLKAKIDKIKNHFHKNEQLITAYDPVMLAKMQSLFEMSKPLIAREILEARNLILELSIVLHNDADITNLIDQKVTMNKLDIMSEEISRYQAILLTGESEAHSIHIN